MKPWNESSWKIGGKYVQFRPFYNVMFDMALQFIWWSYISFLWHVDSTKYPLSRIYNHISNTAKRFSTTLYCFYPTSRSFCDENNNKKFCWELIIGSNNITSLIISHYRLVNLYEKSWVSPTIFYEVMASQTRILLWRN